MKSVLTKNGLPAFWTIQFCGWTVYLAAIYITFLTVAPPDRFLYLFYLKSFRAFTGFVLTSILLRPIYRTFNRDDQRPLSAMICLVLVLSVTVGCLWTIIEAYFVYLTTLQFDVAGYFARSPRIALDYAMTLTAWSAIYLGTKYWLSQQEARELAIASAAEANNAQLEMLRYQINPHFLFNALSSIRASVDNEAETAKEMITRMSEFLRYSLMHESRVRIPLSEEIDAVRNYLAIEKIRFEERLSVAIDVESTADNFQIPSFVLTPLVDNAVKHGLRTSRGPLSINIAARLDEGALILEVNNNGRLDERDAGGTGIGLRNVAERLTRSFGSRASFRLDQENDCVTATIRIAG